MSKRKYTPHEGPPPGGASLHITCLANPLYRSVRWWDTKRWWDISTSRGDRGKPFVWPKGEAANKLSMPEWMKNVIARGGSAYLRNITDQQKVRWCVPYTHFDEKEVLKWLVTQGALPPSWREAFQEHMRTGASLNSPAFLALAGHDFAALDLLKRTMLNMQGVNRYGTPRWVMVKSVFGVGATVAHALCAHFDLDPEDILKKPK